MKKRLLAVAMLCAIIPAFAQRPALTSPVIRFFDNNGKPLAGGKLYTYQATTTTPLSTYTDSTTGALNTNPVILDSTGSAIVFLGNNVYKLVLQNSAGTVQWTADNIAQNAFNQGGGGTSGPAGGDLSGTYPNPVVNKVKGGVIPTSQPCIGTNSSGQLIPCVSASTYYQTIQGNGAALPQQPTLNFIPGSGTAITCVDNPGSHKTDCTFNLGSSTAVDYYWTEAGCVIGIGQPNHCDFTATLPGAMPSASYQVFCTLNFLADTPAAACNLGQDTLPTSSGGSILMRIGQYQQDGTTGHTAPTIYMHAHYGTGGGGGGGGGGFPITLGGTAITALSTTTALTGLSVNGVSLSSGGSTSLFLNQAGGYTSPTGSGTLTSVATASPLGGGPITTTGTVTCTTCVTASSPGNGIAHFAGGTQAVTSSAIDLATSDVTGSLPHANIAATAVTPGSYTSANITVAADGSITGASNGSSAGISGLTAGYIPLAGSATTLTANSHCDDGVTTASTVTCTETVVTPAVVAGTATAAAIAAIPSGAHGIAFDESATAGVPAAAVDYMRADSVTHKIVCSFNNGAEGPCTTGTGTVTSIATTGPITGGTITTTGTIACATCVTSAASLTTGALMTGAGSQASQTNTTGTGVVTALGVNTGTAGAFGVLIASGTSALGTSSISTASCATVVTTAATGVATTDAIIWNTNASIKAVTGYVPATTGGLTINVYPTSGNVNIDVCNWTSGSITPGAVTLNWRVVR